MGISKSYLKDKFQKKQSFQVGGQPKSFPLKPEQVFNRKKDLELPVFNAALVPGGSPEVQKYQKMLNEKYGTFLVEEGAWGPKTQAAYQKYIINKEQPSAFTPTKYRPTLEEFKSVYERMPSYDYGYESLTDVDPTKTGAQVGPLTKERTQQIQALPNEEQLKQTYLGKTFGGLPMFEGKPRVYEGYSPSRTWTNYVERGPYINSPSHKVYSEEYITPLSNTNPLYAYILAPKKGTQSEAIMQNSYGLEDLIQYDKDNRVTGVKDPNALKSIITNLINQPYIQNAPVFKKDVENLKKFTEKDWGDVQKIKQLQETGLFNYYLATPNYNAPVAGSPWQGGKDIFSELLSNPEIAKYAEEKKINLTKKGRPLSFTNQLGDAILAARISSINKIPFGTAASNASSPIIQDPNEFTLAGYLPITSDMFRPELVQKYKNKDDVTFYPNWDDPVKRKEYLKKAGVPEDMMDKVLIHTSPFPIQEYKPLKNKEGQIYKKGGQVKSKLKTSYKNKRG